MAGKCRSRKKTKATKKNQETQEEVELCSKCGSQMVEEEGRKICSSCDTTIDYFGEDEE